MKKRFLSYVAALFIISILPLNLLMSCEKHYDGPDVIAIEYVTVNYMGGTKRYTKLDLESGEVLHKSYYPWESNSSEYNVSYTFPQEKKEELLDAFYTVGLLDLQEYYTSEECVDDGGGWSLNIKYADGTERVSSGSNTGPHEIFVAADHAFYDITDEVFFELVDDSYKAPPVLYLNLTYRIANTIYSPDCGVLKSKKYTWRGKEREEDGHGFSRSLPIKYGVNYEISLRTQMSEEKIKDVTVYTYIGSRSDKKKVNSEHDKKNIEFDFSFNCNYIIVVEYTNGTAEYEFDTLIPSDDGD